MACLNSSTIRVFKHRYPMDYKPDIESIVKDEVLFYHHTVLRPGIAERVWYKVGKSPSSELKDLKIYYLLQEGQSVFGKRESR